MHWLDDRLVLNNISDSLPSRPSDLPLVSMFYCLLTRLTPFSSPKGGLNRCGKCDLGDMTDYYLYVFLTLLSLKNVE